MLLKEKTKINQENLALYCRTGELKEVEGLTPNRVHHYKRLISGVIDDTLKSAYPLTKNLLSTDEWSNLVSDFFSSHKCQSPQVWKMPNEFYNFFLDLSPNYSLKIKYPFLADLLYFEWVELELYMQEDLDFGKYNNVGDYWKSILAVNPESKILILDYPVHLKKASSISNADKGKYYCLCFREPTDKKIIFINLSVLFAFVVEQLYSNITLDEVIKSAAETLNYKNIEKLRSETLKLVLDLHKKKFILGFK